MIISLSYIVHKKTVFDMNLKFLYMNTWGDILKREGSNREEVDEYFHLPLLYRI